MSKYVVAYISFHDNELTQQIVEAESEIKALQQVMGETIYGDETSVAEIQQFAFDCDSMVSVIAI